MGRRHFIMAASENAYDWCIKYKANKRIEPFGLSIEEAVHNLSTSFGQMPTSITWVNGELVQLTYNVWDESLKEGIFGFKGTCPKLFIAWFNFKNGLMGSDVLSIGIAFNGLLSDDTSFSEQTEDYNIISIEASDDISVLPPNRLILVLLGIPLLAQSLFCALEDYDLSKNSSFSPSCLVNISPDAPFFQKPFIFKKEWATDVRNDNPWDFPHVMAQFNKIIVEDGHPNYDSREDCGCIIETSTNKLLVGSSNGFIPNSIEALAQSCFYRSSIKELVIPNSVVSIGLGAFFSCHNLTSVTIPDSITEINSDTFRYCYNITSINIPNGVVSIGTGAFYECTSLSSIVIPDSVTSIGGAAFSGCSSLASITYTGTIEQWGTIFFESSPGGTFVGIPTTVIHCTDGDIAI